MPQYALGGQTPGANPPLEPQSHGHLQLTTCPADRKSCFMEPDADISAEAEKFPAGVPRDEDKQKPVSVSDSVTISEC